MPDIEMCSSTVCSVRKRCVRNWDSSVHKPDREAREQKWIPKKAMIGVGYHDGARDTDCSFYIPTPNVI